MLRLSAFRGHRVCRPARQHSVAAASPGNLGPSGTTIVSTPEEARRVAALINRLPSTAYHAWDTEVADIDLDSQSPVGNGRVICASFYAGPGHDFGAGPRVWIDNLDAAEGTLEEFKGVLEDATLRKTFHNFSFDRHVLFNHGIDVRGLGGDTMHMARVWRTDLKTRGGYSLEAISELLLGTAAKKVSMKDLFAAPRLKKDGSPGKVVILPPLADIQRDPALRARWIECVAVFERAPDECVHVDLLAALSPQLLHL